MKITSLLLVGQVFVLYATSGYGRPYRTNGQQRTRSRRLAFLRRLYRTMDTLPVPRAIPVIGRNLKDAIETTGRSKRLSGTRAAQRLVLNALNPHAQPKSPHHVECPYNDNEMLMTPCPTPNRRGRYMCVDDRALCDGHNDCPGGEDEDGTVCMFHKITMNYMKESMDALFSRCLMAGVA